MDCQFKLFNGEDEKYNKKIYSKLISCFVTD